MAKGKSKGRKAPPKAKSAHKKGSPPKPKTKAPAKKSSSSRTNGKARPAASRRPVKVATKTPKKPLVKKAAIAKKPAVPVKKAAPAKPVKPALAKKTVAPPGKNASPPPKPEVKGAAVTAKVNKQPAAPPAPPEAPAAQVKPAAKAAAKQKAEKPKEPIVAVMTGVDPIGGPTRTLKRAVKERYVLEFYLNATPGSLYDLLSTPSGFSEWFCDDVDVRGDLFTFRWGNDSQTAQCLSRKHGELIRFQWDDEDDPGSYFELRIRIDPMTNETCLVVTDHAWPKDLDEAKALWASEIHTLQRVLGA